METTISVRINKFVLEEISTIEKTWHTDRSEVIRRLLAEAIQKWKIENALKEISHRRISIGKAAKECNLSLWEMLDLVKKSNVDWTGYSKEDLEKDLELFQ
ncbi:MAG: UPF0175 family protein [Nanoarchaeota archaeon]